MGGAEGGEGGEEGREKHSALADSSSKLPFIQSPLRLPFSQDQLGRAVVTWSPCSQAAVQGTLLADDLETSVHGPPPARL